MSFENRDEDKTVPGTPRDSADATTAERDAMRPIPDGGLQQSMPEWLRRPPAWRNLPKREEPAPASLEPAEAPPPAKELPEPDTSEIDPRSLVDISDLPQWLQDVAARSEARTGTTPAPVTIDASPPATEEPAMTDPEQRNPVDVGTERAVPFKPVKKGAMDAPEHETKVYGGGPKTGMSPVMMGIIALVIIVVIALILIAIL